MDTQQTQPPKKQLKLSLDLRLVVVILLIVIIAMLAIWRPWDGGTSDRTISVTGEAVVSAEPDEYIFQPNYQFESPNKEVALGELTKKSEAVVAELKKLGVEDNKIKTNSNGYDLPVFREPSSDQNKQATYNLSLTVTISNKELAQKVQNYLLTTAPTGGVSPQVTFSDAKQRELENDARDQATQDARKKAEQSANNLGFKLGKVKEVSDSPGFDIFPLRGGATSSAEDTTKLSLQPGQNDLNYSVTVVYFVR